MAPHSLKSNIQSAIERHSKKLIEQRLRALEAAFLNGPGKELRGVGIRIAQGEADVVLPHSAKDIDDSGGVLDAVCFKLMSDAAAQAVCSFVAAPAVSAAEFSVTLTHSSAKGELIARGRYVGKAGKHYLADAMLTDADGTELGRGEGVFFERQTGDSA